MQHSLLQPMSLAVDARIPPVPPPKPKNYTLQYPNAQQQQQASKNPLVRASSGRLTISYLKSYQGKFIDCKASDLHWLNTKCSMRRVNYMQNKEKIRLLASGFSLLKMPKKVNTSDYLCGDSKITKISSFLFSL